MKSIDLLPYIVDRIQEKNVKYEVHKFDSGAVMVDIWIDEKFFVIQIDNNTIGLSLVTKDTTPFDIIPDHIYTDSSKFKADFESIFSH